ncbi:hypothetical protein GJU40_03495 [Bacillus lacus]|uniref:Uncharacterized protein n=1 Tax=Metabacillus lacus TaxID=1983721 RepID=A0A7X2IWR3_9BACI|nr:hypothetical protein [Metabacillus lacus]MRX71236.1 hypothetical protein [Metabacillus lacus]
MKKNNYGEMKRGQTISFRIPSDTPDHLLKYLQNLKETERRNFSSKIAEFVMAGAASSKGSSRETITVPLPHQLTKSQRNWLKHEHSEALIGNIIYQLLTDPVRSTSILATLNSKSTDIDEALYLQETENDKDVTQLQSFSEESEMNSGSNEAASALEEDFDADLDDFDWELAKQSEPQAEPEEDTEEDLDDLLGDFLSRMNK